MKRVAVRKKAEIVVFMLMLLGLMSPLKSKVRSVTSALSFERIVGKVPYGVVMFYDHDRAIRKTNPKVFMQNARLEELFKGVGERGAYQEAGIQFLSVNVSKNRLIALAQGYGFTQFPLFVLFKNGMPVTDKQGNKATISGFVTTEQLHEFIGNHWDKDIEQTIKRKQEVRREIERERALYAPALSVGWGYPFGGWGYPYGGWYGGGYGWGRPYRRFGFGIGF